MRYLVRLTCSFAVSADSAEAACNEVNKQIADGDEADIFHGAFCPVVVDAVAAIHQEK